MQPAPFPDNESQRLNALTELEILDSIEEQPYDDLTALAAHICDTPIALVSLVDADRQWFKSHFGLAARQTPRELAFCSHAILDDALMEVSDSHVDLRFVGNPLVTGAPHVRFYAAVPLTIGPGLRVGTLCVIDHRKRSLADHQREALGALGRQVESQLQLRLQLRELKRLDQAKDDFLSLAGHELRTPLTAIYGGLSMMMAAEGRLDRGRQQILLETAHRNAARMLELITNMLDISKIDADHLVLNRRCTDLSALAVEQRGLCNLHGPIEVDAPEPVFASVDPTRVSQILVNLLSNARKFSPPDGTVKLTVRSAGPSVELSVVDQGDGVEASFRPRLFTKFAQADSPDTGHDRKGTGLGLYLSRQLARLHGGELRFNQANEHGTEFVLTLPVELPR